jgi:hypothetical protein
VREVALEPTRTPSATTAPRVEGAGTSRPRPLMIIGLFIFGVLGGALAQSVVNPPASPNPYPQLPVLGEPAETAELMRVILADDARTLSTLLEGEVLQALGEAIQPVEEVLEANFVGSTERNGDILSAYVLTGRVGGIGGQQLLVGVVFRVRDGEIVGVN